MRPAVLSATSSAASVDGASDGRSDGSGAPPATHAAGQLLVRLRARSPARRLLALQNPLPGVAVQGYVGEHHGTPLPAAAAATTATAAALSAAPDGAVLQLRITDGSSVAEKAAQLRRHPGEGSAGRVHRGLHQGAGYCRLGCGAQLGGRRAARPATAMPMPMSRCPYRASRWARVGLSSGVWRSSCVTPQTYSLLPACRRRPCAPPLPARRRRTGRAQLCAAPRPSSRGGRRQRRDRRAAGAAGGRGGVLCGGGSRLHGLPKRPLFFRHRQGVAPASRGGAPGVGHHHGLERRECAVLCCAVLCHAVPRCAVLR